MGPWLIIYQIEGLRLLATIYSSGDYAFSNSSKVIYVMITTPGPRNIGPVQGVPEPTWGNLAALILGRPRWNGFLYYLKLPNTPSLSTKDSAQKIQFCNSVGWKSTNMHRPGMNLIPPPTDHKHDPLRWPRWLKVSVVLSTSLFNFVSNMAGAGPSVAIQVFMQDFSKSQAQVAQLLTVSSSDFHACRVVQGNGLADSALLSSTSFSLVWATYSGFHLPWNWAREHRFWWPWPCRWAL